MTADEWARIVIAAINECGMTATILVVDVDCAQDSLTCRASLKETDTGRLIDIEVDRTPEGEDQMRQDAVEQLKAKRSN